MIESGAYDWKYFHCNWINLTEIHVFPNNHIVVKYLRWFCYCFKLCFKLLKLLSCHSQSMTLQIIFCDLFGYHLPHLLLMVWRGVWDPLFQIRSPIQFRSPPVIQNFKVPLSTSQYHYRQPPIRPSPLFIFFPNPPLLLRLSRQCHPDEILDKHKNKIRWQSRFFIFRRLKTTLNAIFMNNTFIISNTRLRFNLE